MPKYQIIELPDRKPDKDGSVKDLTFSIDGQEVLKRYRRCKVSGMSEDYYVTRTIDRLKRGQSGVFAGVNGNTVITGIVPMRTMSREEMLGKLDQNRRELYEKLSDAELAALCKGGVTKRVATVKQLGPRRWVYVLDGEQSTEEYTTERIAREHAACKSFLTSGRLGKIKAVEEAFRQKHGRACKCMIGNAQVFVVDDDGKRFLAGMTKDGVIKFQEFRE